MGGALPFRAVGGGVPAVRPAVELEDHVRERHAESAALLRLTGRTAVQRWSLLKLCRTDYAARCIGNRGALRRSLVYFFGCIMQSNPNPDLCRSFCLCTTAERIARIEQRGDPVFKEKLFGDRIAEFLATRDGKYSVYRSKGARKRNNFDFP